MNLHEGFTLTKENQDVYFHLHQKRELMATATKAFTGRLLDLGCGKMPYKEIIKAHSEIDVYTGVDIKNEIYQDKLQPDYFWDGKTLPFDSESFDCAIMIEVLEHVPYPQEVLIELARVLNSGSHVLITVPFLWNLHDAPNDEFRYTPFSLERMAITAGFSVTSMEGLGGWHASLATIMSAFVRRAPLANRKRAILSWLALPVVKYLFKADKFNYKPQNLGNGQMITGLKCMLKKN